MSQFEDMQTFVRIVEAGSITKAAEQLGTAKSSVSKRLAELERRLGVTLLNRTTRSQTLTEAGRSYYEQCLRIIDDLQEVEASIKNEHCALAGRIKLAAPLSFGLQHLGRAIREFNDIHPQIVFDIEFNDRKVDLVEEGFDLAIRITRPQDSTLRARKLTDVQVLLVGSPEYFAKYGMPRSGEDLNQGHVRVKYREEPEYWSLVDNRGKPLKVRLPTVLSANNGTFICEAAIEGKGLALLPDFVCYKAIRLGQLIPILRDNVAQRIGCYAMYPPTRHLSARVRSLVDYLAQYFGEKPYWSID